MNKDEKEITKHMSEVLSESIVTLATAINYLADSIGNKGDGITAHIADPEVPEKVEVNPAVSMDQIKTALNTFSKKHGKEKAIAVLDEFTDGTHRPQDVKPEEYDKLIGELGHDCPF